MNTDASMEDKLKKLFSPEKLGVLATQHEKNPNLGIVTINAVPMRQNEIRQKEANN